LITALPNHTRAGRLSRAPIHSSRYVRSDIRAAGTNASHSHTVKSTTKANYASTVLIASGAGDTRKVGSKRKVVF
jgi:hypothetical protein